MNIYIMDSMYFDSVEKLLPAEFAKGYKILLFYEKGRKLPDIVFEYISKGWIILRMLPKKMADCIPLITFEIGVHYSVNPKDKFILWGDASLTGVFKDFLLYDDSASSYMGIRNILRDQTEVKEKFPEEPKTDGKKPPGGKKEAAKKPESKNSESPRKKGKRPDKATVPIVTDMDTFSDMTMDMLNMLEVEDGAVLDKPAVPPKEKTPKKGSDRPADKRRPVSSESKVKPEPPKPDKKQDKAEGKPKNTNDKLRMENKKSAGKEEKTKGQPDSHNKNTEDKKKEPEKQLPATEKGNTKKADSAGSDLEGVLGEFLRKECFKNFKVTDNEVRSVILSLLVSVDASSIRSGMHLYKEQLEQFLSENRARVLYDKTVPSFKTFVDYFGPKKDA